LSVSIMAPTTPQWEMVWVLSEMELPVTGTCRIKGVTRVIFIG
jgi:hypothetical protein